MIHGDDVVTMLQSELEPFDWRQAARSNPTSPGGTSLASKKALAAARQRQANTGGRVFMSPVKSFKPQHIFGGVAQTQIGNSNISKIGGLPNQCVARACVRACCHALWCLCHVR